MDDMIHIKTQFGYIPIDELPVVGPEPLSHKFSKSMIFFGIIIIIIFIFFYSSNCKINKQERVKVITESLVDKVRTSISASSIDVYNLKQPIKLENILIITSDNNMLNIDTDLSDDDSINKFVRIIRKGNGTLYSIDFGKSLDIKEVVLITPPTQFIPHINIDLYNLEKNNTTKVWSYSNYLQRRRDNSISITKMMPSDKTPLIELADLDPSQKIITNENMMALAITENDEEYVSF